MTVDPEESAESFIIKINHGGFAVNRARMTGAELRRVPTPAIPDDYDLWQVVPGDNDMKVEDTDEIEVGVWTRLFTAPKHINAG